MITANNIHGIVQYIYPGIILNGSVVWLTKTITKIPCFLMILILVIKNRTKRNEH